MSRGLPLGLALLHYTAAPVTGGVESILAMHARLLREAGHDVRVVAGRGDHRAQDRAAREGLAERLGTPLRTPSAPITYAARRVWAAPSRVRT